MTKEEAIKKYAIGVSAGQVEFDYDLLCQTLDEYAKQQSIAFFTWHVNKLMEFEVAMATPQPDGIELWKEMKRFEQATIEGRFEIFIEQQNKP